ncbi:MAG: transcription termination/antitermination protein NusA [Ardenticatenaceae bacterium]|nr:transcription termination/antitermination protein NusA [Ardenticatenaceae bacterium]MCB9443817.1 transcription termination/antitermination protein NusA [Ardenticatenaceae bacterium]
MKSEFILAFNEICEQRGLPKEDVFEALKTALASAYRRDMNVSNTQQVIAEIDSRTGDPTIYAEKEIVDSIFDSRTEVLLKDARRLGHPSTDLNSLKLGDLVLVDSTTASFGRIAAQTAKQVLLQRVREAEREQLFEDFSGREGELVNGTVQSISGQHITIGLGRTEAILPKSQQVRGERYRAHDKIRVYVLEVRRTSRGPQIFVSRNHRNLLRRLLELEVPEIYNGQVEIKSIAREAGQRSKVAVMALQPGVDPVGACVGMRGVRIQSIVRELNDEKIDVIEWNPDQETFIAKALSPARVSHVFLDDHPDEGKTAVVVVPDDQLSLAIGREGQNARLAAKLTGWRIDIKSLTESAAESLDRLDDPAVAPAVRKDAQFLEQVRSILAKKAAGRPITSEDYFTLDRLVNAVEGKIIAARSAKHEEVRQKRTEARKQVPAIAWELPLDELDLPGRIHNLLLDNEVETVGHVLMNLAAGDEIFLNYRGFGEKALDTLKEYVANYKLPEEETAVEVEAEAEIPAADLVEAEELEAPAEEPAELVEEPAAEVEIEVSEPEPEPELAVEEETEAEEPEEVLSAIDDLSRPLIEIEKKPEPEKEPKKKPAVVIARPSREEERLQQELEKQQPRRKGKSLVFDEDMGEVVVKRKRKRGRGRPEWEDFEGSDFDLDDF